MSETTPEVVDTKAAPYSEDDPDFTPDPTAVFGTLDTSDTAGGDNEKLEKVTPIFDAARAQDLAYAARAVDPDDTEVAESNVVLPSENDTPDAARERIRAAADAVASDPVPVQDPSLTDSQEQGEKTSQERTADATAQQADQGVGNLGTAADNPTVSGAAASTTAGDQTGTTDTSGTSGETPSADKVTPAASTTPPAKATPAKATAAKAADKGK